MIPINAGKTVLNKKTVKATVTAISFAILYFDKTSIANFSRKPNPAYVIGITLENKIKGIEIIAENMWNS